MIRAGALALLLLASCAKEPTAPSVTVPEERASRPEATPEVMRGEQLLVNGQLDEAQRAFESAIDANPDDARAWLDLGLALEARNQLEAAMKAYEKSVAIDPAFAEALNNLGVLQRESGDLAASIASLERAAALDPDFTAARFNLGLAYEDAKRIDDAEAEYLATIEQTPGDPIPRINLAMMYLEVDRLEDAAAQLRSCVPSVRNDVLLSIAVGEGFRRAEHPEEAIPVLQNALQVAGEPPPTELLAELSLAYYAVEDYDAAEKLMGQAVKQNELDPAIHYAYGSILAKQGKVGKARTHLRRAESLDPDGPYAARARKRLDSLR
jgi:superkiller protein 3